MSDIDDLRAEVRKRRAAVTAKETRIYKNTGIDLKGTKEDPRRPPSVVKKYNTTQLKAYLKNLNNFMMRENGYIPDSSGGFIHKREWLSYKRGERKFNKIVKIHFEKIADIKDPYRNVTIRDAEKLFVPESARARGEIRHRPLNEIIRNPNNIKSADALKKLTKQLNQKLSKEFLASALAAGRKQANQLLDNANLSSMKKSLSMLNNEQFDVLWNYWGFAGRLAQLYESQEGKNVGRFDPLDAQEKSNIAEDVSELIKAANDLKFDKNKNIILNQNISNKQKNEKIRSSYDKINKVDKKEK